ncbi:MAG: InlB B-repeat-containing protein [Methanosarcinaceae archaeon]|nr:InlB B-repeat-containing protein [Methanosarcinaceae archaeon]
MKKLMIFLSFLIILSAVVSVSASDAESVTLTLDPNGGDGEIVVITAENGSVIEIPDCVYTMENATFAFWTPDQDGAGAEEGILFYPGTKCYLYGNDTLYAQWTPLPDYSYSISFDPNCENVSGGMENMAGENGTFVLIPYCGFENPGFDFMYWTLTPEISKVKYYPMMSCPMIGDMTLYAQWTESQRFMIVYEEGVDEQGNPVVSEGLPDSEEVYDRYRYTVENSRSVANGYVFRGWTTEDFSGKEEFVAPGDTFSVSGNVTLKAVWISLPEDFEPTGSDVIALNRIIIEDSEYISRYDLNRDGVLDIFDLVPMAQYVVDHIPGRYDVALG